MGSVWNSFLSGSLSKDAAEGMMKRNVQQHNGTCAACHRTQKPGRNTVKMKNLMILLMAAAAIMFSGCGFMSPFDAVQSQLDEQDTAIEELRAEIDSINEEMASLDARLVETNEDLDEAFALINGLAEDIAEIRRESEEGDQELQDQITGLFDQLWQKYLDLQAQIDQVVVRQDQDRAEFRRGLMIAYQGIARLRWHFNQLRTEFENAAEDFQDQLDALRDDLSELDSWIHGEIEDLWEDVDANAGEIARLWSKVCRIWKRFSDYYTKEDIDLMLAAINDQIVSIRDRLEDAEADIATKATLLEAEQQVYRILFGDNAMNPDGTLKAYFLEKMYWHENFQGFMRVVNGILYEIAWGISHDDYTPPTHVSESVVNALRDYYVSVGELELKLSDIQMQIDELDSAYENLASSLSEVTGDYLTMADYLVLMDVINTLRTDMEDELATKLSVYTFRYNRDMIYSSLEDYFSLSWLSSQAFEFKLHDSVASVDVSVSESIPLTSFTKTGNTTFEVASLFDLGGLLAETIEITATVSGVGTATLEDVPLYKVLLDGIGTYPQLRVYDSGSHQSLVLDSQFGSVAVRF